MKHTYTYICEECVMMFQTFGFVPYRKPFCPKCGESYAVTSQNGTHSTKEEVTNLKTRWKGEELEVLNRCIKGELKPYQVCILTGRSSASVHKKLKRMK